MEKPNGEKKMQKLDVLQYGGLNCTSQNCVFRRECANHDSAGDFRSEDGFTPRIEVKDGEYLCSSIDAKIKPDTRYGFFPEDSNDRGMLSIDPKTGELKNFSIFD